MLVIGDREMEAGHVALRRRSGENRRMSVEEFWLAQRKLRKDLVPGEDGPRKPGSVLYLVKS